ncbi:uncharacterized protein LOC105692930 [Athalia rosae]|uniref:uncharacterized protein LOC105692930 n=1 Tax=Athalia rosae TaxID=37344 RepID=UPI0020342FE7|nr:uncharacterized protein LOC105692930 [Athalia rosae]
MTISAKVILNFGVCVALVSVPRAYPTLLKRDQLPESVVKLHEMSQISFTRYSDVPMLTLDEISQGFPWLKNAEIRARSDRREDAAQGASENAPKYVFYYAPSEVTLQTGNRPRTDAEKQKDGKNQRKESAWKRLEISDRKKSGDGLQGRRNVRPDPEAGKRKKNSKVKSKFERSKSGSGRKTNREYREGESVEESKRWPNYYSPKTPALYMQPPRLEYEDEEFWVGSEKRKPKKQADETGSDERLENHRTAKKRNKLKNSERDDNRKYLANHRPIYDREHDPLPEELTEESSDGRPARAHRRPIEAKKDHPKLSQDGERINFQIHGHEGPQTYIFGYDTGNGENRHFRLEERLRDGSVKGHYGFYDANGKLKMVEYKASPMNGYEEKHHAAENHKFEAENAR